jgi:hypothetical protein
LHASSLVALVARTVDRDVRALLETVGSPGVGALANPLDWLHGGARILKGAAKIVASNKIDGQSVADIVEGVIIIVRKNGSHGDQKKK